MTWKCLIYRLCNNLKNYKKMQVSLHMKMLKLQLVNYRHMAVYELKIIQNQKTIKIIHQCRYF